VELAIQLEVNGETTLTSEPRHHQLLWKKRNLKTKEHLITRPISYIQAILFVFLQY